MCATACAKRLIWCGLRDSNPYTIEMVADFKSAASTNSAKSANTLYFKSRASTNSAKRAGVPSLGLPAQPVNRRLGSIRIAPPVPRRTSHREKGEATPSATDTIAGDRNIVSLLSHAKSPAAYRISTGPALSCGHGSCRLHKNRTLRCGCIIGRFDRRRDPRLFR